jgi:predicted AAA+ superfamily ATPase
MCHLHPLISQELNHARLLDRLNRGSLPAIIDSTHFREDLRAYIGTYLWEEIRAEGLARSIENFSRFLEVAGLTNGEQVDFTSVGSDTGVPPRTIREHYQILEDTLIGYQLPAYRKTTKRKPVATAKFYFFDVGVAAALQRAGVVEEGSDAYGRALEHLVFLELRTYLDYRRLDHELTYWRSRSGLEVDFVIGDHAAIEVKAKSRVVPHDYRGILALAEEVGLKRRIVVCGEKRRRISDEGVEVTPVLEFFQELWNDQILT